MPRKAKEPFIPVNRSFFESEFWLSEPFTPAQAWLDLNFLAAYERTTVSDGRRSYDLDVGQVRTTLDKLAKRWKWNRKRVWEQVRVWKRNKLVYTQGDKHGYTLTIENYGFVGLYGNTQGNTQGDTQGDTNVTHEGTREGISSIYTRNKNKELKNKDPQIIREFIDPKTGEERIVIRP